MKLTYLFLIVALLFSCHQQNHLPANTMKVIIWEMTCADELLKITHPKDKQSKEYLTAQDYLYQQIFAVHNISAQTFYKSYQYYSNNTLKFKALIDSSYAYGQRQKNLLKQTLKETKPTSETPKKEFINDSATTPTIKLDKIKKISKPKN